MLEVLFGEELKVFGTRESVDGGDIMSMDEFAESVESGSLIDYDGFAKEVIIDDKIVNDEYFYPSDFEEHIDEFNKLQREKGKVEIVWYNR